jgi:hypothetical protein
MNDSTTVGYKIKIYFSRKAVRIKRSMANWSPDERDFTVLSNKTYSSNVIQVFGFFSSFGDCLKQLVPKTRRR